MRSDVFGTPPPPLEKSEWRQRSWRRRPRPPRSTTFADLIMKEMHDQTIVAGVRTQLQQAAHHKKCC